MVALSCLSPAFTNLYSHLHKSSSSSYRCCSVIILIIYLFPPSHSTMSSSYFLFSHFVLFLSIMDTSLTVGMQIWDYPILAWVTRVNQHIFIKHLLCISTAMWNSQSKQNITVKKVTKQRKSAFLSHTQYYLTERIESNNSKEEIGIYSLDLDRYTTIFMKQISKVITWEEEREARRWMT